jgi:hypothetical protein
MLGPSMKCIEKCFVLVRFRKQVNVPSNHHQYEAGTIKSYIHT